MKEHIVTATSDASRRTKNRIRENGPSFHLGREMPVVISGEFGRVQAMLLHSTKNNWVGWVPVDEVNILGKYDKLPSSSRKRPPDPMDHMR